MLPVGEAEQRVRISRYYFDNRTGIYIITREWQYAVVFQSISEPEPRSECPLCDVPSVQSVTRPSGTSELQVHNEDDGSAYRRGKFVF